MLFAYYSMLFLISIVLCFQIDFEMNILIKNIYITILILGIFIKINTGYLKKDTIIKKRTKIFFNYITSTEFYVDIIVIFPFLYDTMNKSNFFMIMCFLNI